MSNYYVHIPNCIIRNEDDIEINSKEFQLYYYFKILYDKQKKNTIQFNHNQYMSKFEIKTNSTLKRMLEHLYEQKLILNKIDKFVKGELLTIQLNKKYIGLEPFTRLPINVYYMIPEIGHEGLRLLYYYESKIVRSEYDRLYSYPGIRTIEKQTKINKNKIIKLNQKLQKMKLLKVVSSELGYSGQYDEFDQEIKTKFTNKYYLLMDNIKNYSSSTRVG